MPTSSQPRRRKRFIDVQEAGDGPDGAVTTTAEYLTSVAALLSHQVYFFPGLGLQVALYLAWLLERVGGRPLDLVRRTDARARQAMALSPRELMTAADLDHFVPGGGGAVGGGGGAAAAARPAPLNTNHRQVCWRYLRGACERICPAGRLHGPDPAMGGAAARPGPRPAAPGFPRQV